VIHVDAALGQQLLDVSIGQAIPQIPADRERDHLWRELGSSKRSTATSSHHASLLPTSQRNSAVTGVVGNHLGGDGVAEGWQDSR